MTDKETIKELSDEIQHLSNENNNMKTFYENKVLDLVKQNDNLKKDIKKINNNSIKSAMFKIDEKKKNNITKKSIANSLIIHTNNDTDINDVVLDIDNNMNTDNTNTDNGWFGANNNTVQTWKNNFAEMSFIYNIALQKYKLRLANVAMLAFIISSLQTTLSFSNLGISETNYPMLALIAKITMIILSLIINVSNGMIKIYKWNDNVEIYKGYTEKLEGFFTILVSETELPKSLRKNALDFIVQHKTSYMEILRSSPDIDQSDYLKGSEQYIKLKNKKTKHCKGIKLKNLEVEINENI